MGAGIRDNQKQLALLDVDGKDGHDGMGWFRHVSVRGARGRWALWQGLQTQHSSRRPVVLLDHGWIASDFEVTASMQRDVQT